MVPPVSHRVSRVLRYSGTRLTEISFHLRGYHPLWLAFPYHSVNLFCRCVGPQPRRINPSVCPLPRSLATTCGISVDFSSSPYLDVSVQAVPHVHLFDSMHADRVLLCRVSPFGNLRVKAYVQLTAAYRSLSRPSSALDAKAFPLRSYQLDLSNIMFSGSQELCRPQIWFIVVCVTLYYKVHKKLCYLSVACSQFLACFTVQFSRCRLPTFFKVRLKCSGSCLNTSI